MINGHIDTVSSQAIQSGSDGPPAFNVRVITGKLSPEQQNKLRLGMTTNLEVVVYENPKALTVPIEAVHTDPRGGSAVTLLQEGGDGKEVTVTTGITTEDRVEITEGLKAGDKVSLPTQSSQSAQSPKAAQPSHSAKPKDN